MRFAQLLQMEHRRVMDFFNGKWTKCNGRSNKRFLLLNNLFYWGTLFVARQAAMLQRKIIRINQALPVSYHFTNSNRIVARRFLSR